MKDTYIPIEFDDVFWNIHAELQSCPEEFEPAIRLFWGWTAGFTKEQKKEVEDECSTVDKSVSMFLSQAIELRDRLNILIEEGKKDSRFKENQQIIGGNIMYSFEDFQKAIKAYEDKHNACYCAEDNYELKGYGREDIISLSQQFVEKYGFRLLEIEIFQIWKWHSNDFAATFLCADKDPLHNMPYFDEFVKTFLSP